MYNKLILTTALGLVMFASESLAETTGSCGSTCTYTMDDAGNVVITGTGALGTLQGVDRKQITSVTIPDGITSIGTNAFNGAKITSINIPNSVTSIGNNAFSGSALESIVIPNSVTSIGEEAFRQSKLTNVIISDGVTSIGVRAFYNIPTLTNAEIQGNNVNIDSSAFGSIPAQVQHTGNVTWSCGTDCTATLDKSGHVEFVGTGALTSGLIQGFKRGITNAIISDGITSIGSHTFDGSTLETVVIPNSVTSIASEAFRQSNLKSVTIPDSVTSIGEYAFYNIPTLTSLVLPDSVISIGSSAFGSNWALAEIFCPKASVESGRCASMASAGGARAAAKIGYYKDDAYNEERIFYLKDENGVWQEARRESIYEKYVSDTGAIFLYDSKGNLKKMRGKKIYTVEEAMAATQNGNRFHVGLTYK